MKFRQKPSDEFTLLAVTGGIMLLQVMGLALLMVLAYYYHWRVNPWISMPIGILWLFALKLNLELTVHAGSEWMKAVQAKHKQAKVDRAWAAGNTPDSLADGFTQAVAEVRAFEARSASRDKAWHKQHETAAELLNRFIKSLAAHKPPTEWNAALEELLRRNDLPPWIRDGGEYLDFIRNPNAPHGR